MDARRRRASVIDLVIVEIAILRMSPSVTMFRFYSLDTAILATPNPALHLVEMLSPKDALNRRCKTNLNRLFDLPRWVGTVDISAMITRARVAGITISVGSTTARFA